MAQEELRFTVADNGQGKNNGAKVDVTFTYGGTKNSDGSYTVTGASGTYQTLDANGNVVNSYTVTGIAAPGGGNSSDNHLFIVGDPTKTPIATYNGISFTISSTAPTGTNPAYINFYDQNGSASGGVPNDTPEYHLNNTNNGNAATAVTETAATCFTSGTRILTTRGDIAVEALAAGDLVVTASGEHRPIRWIGHRLMNCRRFADARNVMPVRIHSEAFGSSCPARDLVVSPGHALCVDICGEVLIPAIALINGSTIVQEEVEHVTYWHVELEGGHDILLAENMPAESYLDMGNRGFFNRTTDSGTVVDLAAAPDADPALRSHADFCRPFHDGGPVVEAIREGLALRAQAAGWTTETVDVSSAKSLAA